MVDLVPLTFCREYEITSVSNTPPAVQSDAQDISSSNDTGVTEDITRPALEALFHFQVAEERNARSLGNNEAGDFNNGLEAEYLDDQVDEEHAEDDEDEYWASIRNRAVEREGETDYVEGPLVEDLALSTNERPEEDDGTYLDTDDSNYVDKLEGAVDTDGNPDDSEVSLVIQYPPFAERYYGVAGHMPENPDEDDDWSSSDYSSEPDYSDDEPDSQDKKSDKNCNKKVSLFTQYKRILPPNLFIDCDPPTQFPNDSIYHTPDTFDIPQGIYALVKDIALDSVYCEVVMARSMMMRVNHYGLKKGSLCCMKIYPKRQDSPERTRKSNNQLKTEVKAYQRLAEAARRDKPGFWFLTQLDASLQDESRCFLIMPLMKTDLRSILQNNGLPRADFAREMEIRRLLAQMAVGIATLHSIGIIHRDIKPENILIDFYGNIQIADFGVSMVRDDCEPCLKNRRYCWESVGTWPYAAPELTLGKNPLYGLEVDYWALGCIAFEMEGWGHQGLFENYAEYDYWCSIGGGTVSKRLKFLASADLSQTAFVLICGLLHPDPFERYGIVTLLKHPYFMVKGVSEFHCLGERAACRQREPFIPSVVPHMPVKYAPRVADNTPHGWINPRGAFFP